jgi:membrane protein YdbS with pleckstrin-like domain
VCELLPDKPEIDRGEEIIGKRIIFIPLDMVQDVTCRFGILGRVFGFGDLKIESAGTYRKIVFSFISNHSERKEEIGKAILEFKANIKNMEGKEEKIEP